MNYCPSCGEHNYLNAQRDKVKCSYCGALVEHEALITEVKKAYGVWINYLHQLANGVIDRPKEKKDEWRQW